MNLQDAAEYGDLDCVQLFLRQGIDKDEADDDGYTALWNAAYAGHLAIVQCLVEQGADIDKAASGGITPLSIAASDVGHVEVVRYLLEQGADRDKADIDGLTPLHVAAIARNLEIAMLLMSYGADLNARNEAGELPIDFARTEEMKQAIRDESRRRLDHYHKRATEQDLHPNAAASASAQQEEETEDEQQNSKRPRLDEGVAEAKETKVAEEDEDSKPSSDEEGDN